MRCQFATKVGIPAYDAARWLLPPPPVRNVLVFESGASCLIQDGASLDPAIAQEIIVKDRTMEGLIIFPDGADAFEFHCDGRVDKVAGGFAVATLSAYSTSGWLAQPNTARAVHLHWPTGLRSKLTGHNSLLPFQDRLFKPDENFRLLLNAFCAFYDSSGATPMLLETYVTFIVQQCSAPALVNTARGGLAAWQLSRAKDIIAGRLQEGISLGELADEVQLSPYHFCRAFKRSTGYSPHVWLMMRRMDRAMELMSQHPEIPLTSIALSAGYSNLSAFGAAFRRVTATTPNQWRRQHKR